MQEPLPMTFSEEVRFESSPARVRQAIVDYVSRRFPRALSAIHWDAAGIRARASRMGARGTLCLRGQGPTILQIDASVGLPASLLVSRATVRRYFRQAVKELKKIAP